MIRGVQYFSATVFGFALILVVEADPQVIPKLIVDHTADHETSNNISFHEINFSQPNITTYPTSPSNATQVIPTNTSVSSSVDRDCVCGISNDFVTRIVGGERSAIQKYPWMVGISVGNHIYCGGALLNEEYVVTTAHCFKHQYIAQLAKVNVGITFRNETTSPIEIEKIIRHENYRANVSGFYDLTLLKLKTKVTFNSAIVPVCLPEEDEVYTHQYATVAGWGTLRHGGELSESLQGVELKVLDLSECQKIFHGHKRRVDENNVCAGGEKGRDACQGDSGSPLFIKKDGVFRVIGLVSWGIGCAIENVPGVYTNIAYYAKWIKSHMDSPLCMDPSRVTV